MRILGIETSCDETAVAVIEADGDNISVLSNIVSSQVKLHAKFGGVVPSLAAREHVKNIGPVFETALKEAGIAPLPKSSKPKAKSFFPIDLIAVTRGPGLAPSLLIGLTFARTLAWLSKKPVIGVNHLDGHVHSNWLLPIGTEAKSYKLKAISSMDVFPALNLVVSGGHTELVLMRGHGKYKIIGETQDDAVGEAFDKVARLLELGYPGGPAIAKRAADYRLQTTDYRLSLPRPMIHSKDFNFSYSGLKTAVLYRLRDLKTAGIPVTDEIKNEICHEFQNAATEVLVQKTIRAARQHKVRAVLLSGGVSANRILRQRLENAVTEAALPFFCPPMEYTGDNAAMIAVAGYFNFQKGKKYDWRTLKMDSNLSFDF